MTKTMIGGLLTWLCGLVMLLALLANVTTSTASNDSEVSVPAHSSAQPAVGTTSNSDI
mgnify:CR=1 FL=1